MDTPLKRLKEMCKNISMSIIEKVFKYEATELPVIKYEDEIWFKAVAVATILKYTNQRKAIRDHVDPKDKRDFILNCNHNVICNNPLSTVEELI